MSLTCSMQDEMIIMSTPFTTCHSIDNDMNMTMWMYIIKITMLEIKYQLIYGFIMNGLM